MILRFPLTEKVTHWHEKLQNAINNILPLLASGTCIKIPAAQMSKMTILFQGKKAQGEKSISRLKRKRLRGTVMKWQKVHQLIEK